MSKTLKPLSLDQLVALNNEITALCGAGIPLEQGLRQAASRMQGNQQDIANRLAEAMEKGATLEQAIESQGSLLPETYRAFVRAGCQSGQLGNALESLSEISSRVASMRQVVLLAALYPFVLLLIGWSVLLFANRFMLPEFEWIGSNFVQQLVAWQDWFLGSWKIQTLALLVFLVIGLFFWRQTKPAYTQSKLQLVPYDRLPFLGRVYRLSAQACFADLLRHLLLQEVPLEKALPLAADATGYASLQSACNRAAADLQLGKTPSKLPPMVRLALSTSQTAEQTNHTLRLLANAYRQQANAYVENCSTFLPIFATCCIGGPMVFVYTIMMFYPYIDSLKALAFWY